MNCIVRVIKMNATKLKEFALSLGYTLADEDCEEILSTTFEGESVEKAVNDFLNAYER
jgi:hypothetical protein